MATEANFDEHEKHAMICHYGFNTNVFYRLTLMLDTNPVFPPQSHTEPVWVTSPFFLLSFLWDWSALRGKRGKKSFSNPFIFSGSIQIKGLGITKGLPIRFNKGRPVVEPASNFSVSRLQSSCICQRARRQTWKAFCLICLVNRSFTYMNLKGSTNVVHQNQLTCRGNASQPL